MHIFKGSLYSVHVTLAAVMVAFQGDASESSDFMALYKFVFNFAKEVMFMTLFVCWCVCLSAGLLKSGGGIFLDKQCR